MGTEPYQTLEAAWAAFVGLPPENVVVCSSGTAALHLAIEAINLPTGGQVVVPEYTNIACARACTLAGLRPVFVDCGDDLLLDPAQLEDAVTEHTVAIMPVHIYGRRCDMAAIRKLADARGLFVIEDCAEFHGGRVDQFSDAWCWSFYRNKIVAGEEGGAVAFRNVTHAHEARLLRSLGQDVPHTYFHRPRGHNYRLSNAHAELILASLASVRENLKKRAVLAEQYARELTFPLSGKLALMPPREVNWVYDLRVTAGNAPDVVTRLNAAGIAARPAFRPMSEQAEYRGHFRHLKAFARSQDTFYLPVDPAMDERRVREVVDAVHRAVTEAAPGLPVRTMHG